MERREKRDFWARKWGVGKEGLSVLLCFSSAASSLYQHLVLILQGVGEGGGSISKMEPNVVQPNPFHTTRISLPEVGGPQLFAINSGNHAYVKRIKLPTFASCDLSASLPQSHRWRFLWLCLASHRPVLLKYRTKQGQSGLVSQEVFLALQDLGKISRKCLSVLISAFFPSGRYLWSIFFSTNADAVWLACMYFCSI